MNFACLRRKLLLFLFLIVFVFCVFQVVSCIAPSIWRFSARSAVTSLKFNLPESSSWLEKLSFKQSNMVNFDGELRNDSSSNLEFDSNESNLFKSHDDALLDFEPPFLVGPERVSFSKKELMQFNEKDGPIYRNCYRAGKSNKIVEIGKSVYVKNLTDLPNSFVKQTSMQAPSFNLTNDKNPQVLILHTHATESYELQEKAFYSKAAASHSKNSKLTVLSVGDEITKQLQAANIGVIHDKTIHDSPSYTGAYDRSNQTIRNYLYKHPSIKVVLDVHRDGIQNDKLERFAPVVKIDGRKAAQIMIISGCDVGNKIYPNYAKNLAFACFLQKHFEEVYPKLMRPLLFKYKHYNQSLTPGTLLIEIGSNSNSIDEAMYSGWLFGKALSSALLKLKK